MCFGTAAARTPQTARMAPPAAVKGAAALLAAAKAASLRIGAEGAAMHIFLFAFLFAPNIGW